LYIADTTFCLEDLHSTAGQNDS